MNQKLSSSVRTKKVRHHGRGILMALCLMISIGLLSACGSTRVTKYRAELAGHVDTILSTTESLQETLNDLQGAMADKDETLYQDGLESLTSICDTLTAEYKAIAEVKAPEEYQEQQEQMKAYVTTITETLSAMPELYTLAGQSFNGELSDETVQRIGVLQNKVTGAVSSADAFDKLLNEVLGYTEEE